MHDQKERGHWGCEEPPEKEKGRGMAPRGKGTGSGALQGRSRLVNGEHDCPSRRRSVEERREKFLKSLTVMENFVRRKSRPSVTSPTRELSFNHCYCTSLSSSTRRHRYPLNPPNDIAGANAFLESASIVGHGYHFCERQEACAAQVPQGAPPQLHRPRGGGGSDCLHRGPPRARLGNLAA